MRRDARENVFKIIFEKLINNGKENELTYQLLTEGLHGEDDLSYFNLVFSGVNSTYDFLKESIASYITTYQIDRVYKVDLAILMVASYEIVFLDDVPDKVAINEAVEIAKIYSTDNSPSFINGVLASVVKNKIELREKYESKDN